MTILPGFGGPILPMVSTIGVWGIPPAGLGTTGAPTSGAWESADRAVYIPIQVPVLCVVRRVWWANGATVSGGATIEVGVYSQGPTGAPKTKLVSGSAVQGSATQVQFVDVTDTVLPPGQYWLAIMASSVTNTTLFTVSIGSGGVADIAGRFVQASANPLPSSATPAETANANIWFCGFSTTTIT